MRLIILSAFCFALTAGWPQFVIEPVVEPEGPTYYETDLEPDSQIDPGLIGSEPETGLGLEEGGIKDDVPDIVVIDDSERPVVEEDQPQRPFTPVVIYRRRNPIFPWLSSPMFNFRFGFQPDRRQGGFEPDVGMFDGPPRRPSRPQHPFDIFNSGFFSPNFDPFPSFFHERPRFPTRNIPEELPREPETPEEVFPDSETGASDPEGGVIPVEEDTQVQQSPERHPFNPFIHFFRPNFGFGSPSFDSFPHNLPDDYSNSTYRVKEVDGQKVSINETIKKHSGDNFNAFFHFKVVKPVHDEEKATETPQIIDEEYVPTDEEYIPTDEEYIPDEELPGRSDIKPLDEGYVDEPPINNEEFDDATSPPEELPMFNFDFPNLRENEINNEKPNLERYEPTV